MDKFPLLNFAFFICCFFKKGSLGLTGAYSRLLLIFYLCWFVASMMGKKFKPSSYVAYGTGILTFIRSSLYLIYRKFSIGRFRSIHFFTWQWIKAGGNYIVYAHTITTRYQWIYKKFPRQIAGLIYLADFCFNRIMPKLPGLQKGGKLENDFRMTTWGKFMRKLWLDELPMLYNWIKGDLRL